MALQSEKERQQLKRRFKEMADKSFSQNIYTFSGFLGLSEQDEFFRMEAELGFVPYKLFGGREGADRCILRFGNKEELGYEEPFPIVCIHMKPLMEKFSDDFSHRDFLGALMNLGIERSTIGDILVGNREGYLFCLHSMADYICRHLDRVRNTNISCRITENIKELPEEKPDVQEVLVSSERVDVLLAKVYNKSRKEALSLFTSGKVFINGRMCESNSRMLKPGDVINARGFGKFVYRDIKHQTKKGRLCVQIAIYR